MSDRPRIVQAMEQLPTYALAPSRIANMDKDVREAAARARKRAEEHAQKYVVTGWTPDPEPEVGIIGDIVVVRLRLTRDA